jgi:hypothetical protein
VNYDNRASLIVSLAAPDESFDHEGINPQRINDNSLTGSFGFWRMTGTGWVGAMLSGFPVFLRTGESA